VATGSSKKERFMSFVAWFLVGVLAGLIAARICKHTASTLALDVLLGAVGAILGGLAFSSFGSAGITSFNILSWFGAVAGAVAVLLGYRAIFRPAA
jgi:uncharacterized membrane protein YeaQ/YmgE (transglycosylase-associated protein family)